MNSAHLALSAIRMVGNVPGVEIRRTFIQMRRDREHSEIELLRGGRLVSTLTGAFGQSIRETRLTALLGYLIAIDPAKFLPLFGFQGEAQRVCLESRHENGRSDILVETSRGIGIIEAKIDATDPIRQSRRYGGHWLALLTHHVPRKRTIGNANYVSWQQLAKLLKELSQSAVPRLKMLSADLLAYLEEHHMAKKQESVEIYAREINEPITLNLFLKGRVYGCLYKAGSRLSEALYFAPHFGQKVTGGHAGVGVGISYIARITSVAHAATWADFLDVLRQERGQMWSKKNQVLLRELRSRWKWNKTTHRSILLLDQPRLAFNPPILKGNLQKGTGWLSKHFFSFDELYAAWGI